MAEGGIYQPPAPAPLPAPPASPIVYRHRASSLRGDFIRQGEASVRWGPRPDGRQAENEGYWTGTQTDPLVSFIAYHAQAANPGGTRTITDARLRGKSVSMTVAATCSMPNCRSARSRSQQAPARNCHSSKAFTGMV